VKTMAMYLAIFLIVSVSVFFHGYYGDKKRRTGGFRGIEAGTVIDVTETINMDREGTMFYGNSITFTSDANSRRIKLEGGETCEIRDNAFVFDTKGDQSENN